MCGPGVADPFLRQDINGLATSRFSTGRLLSQEIAHSGADIRFSGRESAELFTYGVGEMVPPATGYADCRNGDASMTNCNMGGALVGRQQVFMTNGIAVQLGVPYIPGDGLTEHYPRWLGHYEKQIREALAGSISMEMRHGNVGLRYRLGSLLSYGSVFGPVTGEAPPTPVCDHVCGAQLKHQGLTFATCALAVNHAEEKHRDGTIIWTGEGARELADRTPRGSEPKAFSPFLMATVLDTGEYSKPTVGLELGNAGLSFENSPVCPTSTCDSVGVMRRTRVAVPVRAWLFGHPAIMPEPMMCGVPATVDIDAFLRNRPGYR